MNNIEVVYTMWENLKKTGSMDVGQVGFHKHKEVPFLLSKLVFDQQLWYLFSCKIFLSFQNNLENLDPSCMANTVELQWLEH